MKTLSRIPAMVLLAATSFYGCSKDENVSGDMTADASDFEQFEQIANDADDLTAEAFSQGSISLRVGETNGIQSCAIVTNDTINRVLTIDFGNGCVGHDGRLRSGQILVAYNGHYLDPGFYRNISFNNFFVDSNQVTGQRNLTNNGINGAGHLTWSVTAQNLRVTQPSGSYHEWNSARTRELIAGDTSPHWVFDDVYLITGSGSSVNSNQATCTVTILSALRKEVSCRWLVSGAVEIFPANRPVRVLDYGNGNCDRHATVTMNGVTRNILLR